MTALRVTEQDVDDLEAGKTIRLTREQVDHVISFQPPEVAIAVTAIRGEAGYYHVYSVRRQPWSPDYIGVSGGDDPKETPSA